MRVSYPVTYEMFAALQPPFLTSKPPGRGQFFFLQIAIAVAGAGFVLVFVRIAYLLGQTSLPSASLSKGIGVFVLGALPVLGTWTMRKISARQMRRQHEEFPRDRYSRLHCRDQRFLDATEDGLLFRCSCQVVPRPWSQLTTLFETDRDFVMVVGAESHIIPGSAFSTRADCSR